MIIFVDIDGTIADWSHRAKKAGKMPSVKNRRKFSAWLRKLQPKGSVYNDKPIMATRILLMELREAIEHGDVKLVYLTGRESHLFLETNNWLTDNLFPPGFLITRPKNKRWKTPAEFKIPEMKRLLEYERAQSVLVIDDDPDDSCSPEYTKNGWVHLKVKT